MTLNLTARQYGEVVLPDAASGRRIVPVGQKAVTVQGGYGALFAVRVQILLSITSVGVQMRSGAGNKSRCTKFKCGYWCGRGTSYYKAVKGAGVKAKSVTNNLPILSVLVKVFVIFG